MLTTQTPCCLSETLWEKASKQWCSLGLSLHAQRGRNTDTTMRTVRTSYVAVGAWTLLSMLDSEQETPKEGEPSAAPLVGGKPACGVGCFITWKSSGTAASTLNSGVLTRIPPTLQSQKASAEQAVTTLSSPSPAVSGPPSILPPSCGSQLLHHVPRPVSWVWVPLRGPCACTTPFSQGIAAAPVPISPLNSQKATHLVKTRRHPK